MSNEVFNNQELQAEFSRLAEIWKEETIFSSKIEWEHPAYQQIIALGEPIVPIILEELQRQPGHWFIALAEITGENPVEEDHRGRVELMTDDWLEWGRSRGLLLDTSEQ